jgi:hypothetical protein
VQKLIKNCPPDVAPNVQNSNYDMNMRRRNENCVSNQFEYSLATKKPSVFRKLPLKLFHTESFPFSENEKVKRSKPWSLTDVTKNDTMTFNFNRLVVKSLR